MEVSTRQVLAFHVGDHSQASAERLWANLPAAYREQAIFYPDQYAVYAGAFLQRDTAPSPSSPA